ncbi:MAG: PEP-CTERM sorting domain-containing protein [Pirellulales bacterium]
MSANAGSDDLSTSMAVNQAAINGTYIRVGNIVTLTLPVNINIDIDNGSGTANLQGTVSVSANISTGDFDQDGNQDGHDFLVWQQGFGTLGGAVLGDGDGNFDGSVLAADLILWQGGFGSSPAAVATVRAVPEPSSLVLLGLAAMVASVVGRNHRPT